MNPKILIALALAALLGGGAQAQQKPSREATLGGGAGSGPTLTREQLRGCLVEQDALKTERESVMRDKSALDAEKTDLQRAGEALKAKLEAIDPSNADALKAHIEESKAHDQRIDGWSARLPAFNDRAQALNTRSAVWKTDCGDRRYKEDDLILLQARKQVPAGAK
jgi:chromosome segregation ATPase